MTTNKNQSLLEALNSCAAACNYCAVACLDEPDVKMLTTCIKLDMDCAAICQLTASFVARNSKHAGHLKKECAEICDECATECEKHAKHGMEHCKICAEACRKCASSCRQAA
jgi:hypothetical protein